MKFKNIMLISLIFGIIFSGCSNYKFDISEKVSEKLNECDEEQKIINMPIIPGCYIKIFKEDNWTEQKVKDYVKYRFDFELESNKIWSEKLVNYYVEIPDSVCLVAHCEDNKYYDGIIYNLYYCENSDKYSGFQVFFKESENKILKVFSENGELKESCFCENSPRLKNSSNNNNLCYNEKASECKVFNKCIEINK
jgi:hypothetical protein